MTVFAVRQKCWPEGTVREDCSLVQTSYSRGKRQQLFSSELEVGGAGQSLGLGGLGFPLVLRRAARPRVRRKQRIPSSMSSLHFRRVERRRTPRVSVFADLTVQGLNEQKERFRVQTRSLSVSGHGGLTVLDVPVTIGQTLFLVNDNSRQKAECKVVSVRTGGNGKTIVAFEFVETPTDFWKISFPQAGTKPLRRSLPSAATA